MSAKPLALMILDSTETIVYYGGLGQADAFAVKIDQWNRGDIGHQPFRVVPVGEIPAWQPIATAPRDGTEILVYEIGGMYFVRWESGTETWVSTDSGAWIDDATHWQPLPAAPKEAE